MNRYILPIRIIGALAFMACMYFMFSGAFQAALALGWFAALCVCVVIANQLTSFYHSYQVKRRRS